MQTDFKKHENPTDANNVLCAGILAVLRNDWSNCGGDFDAYWFGYDALKDQLHENGIEAEIKEIRQAIMYLSKQGMVELKPTYNDEFGLSGSGWFACNT